MQSPAVRGHVIDVVIKLTRQAVVGPTAYNDNVAGVAGAAGGSIQPHDGPGDGHDGVLRKGHLANAPAARILQVPHPRGGYHPLPGNPALWLLFKYLYLVLEADTTPYQYLYLVLEADTTPYQGGSNSGMRCQAEVSPVSGWTSFSADRRVRPRASSYAYKTGATRASWGTTEGKQPTNQLMYGYVGC
eukprot:1191183-Prorocentrum_minimum.AAC.2